MARRPDSRLPRPPSLPGGSGPSPNTTSLRRALHWGAIMGGLVIIADLAARLTETPGGTDEVDTLNIIISALFYSLAGTLAYRDTRRIGFGALAGLIAGALDGLVIGAAELLAPRPGLSEGVTPLDVFTSLLVLNVALGVLLATLSAWFGALIRRRDPS